MIKKNPFAFSICSHLASTQLSLSLLLNVHLSLPLSDVKSLASSVLESFVYDSLPVGEG